MKRNITAIICFLFYLSSILSYNAWGVTPHTLYPDIQPSPTQANQIASQQVVKYLTNLHYRKIYIDDAFSQRILARYLELLDRNRMFFLRKDVEEIQRKYGKYFGESIEKGYLTDAFDIYHLMQDRKEQFYDYVLSLLEKTPNLADKEKIEVDRTKAPWATNEKVLHNLWRKRFENDVINQKLKGRNWDEIRQRLKKRYQVARHRLRKITADEITELVLNALTQEIDPHTTYLSPLRAKRFEEGLKLSLTGIGATLQMVDDETVIKSLIVGAPASKSKQLKVGDKIIGVGDAQNEIEDVVGWQLDDVVEKIKGKSGTTVYLEVEPEKGGKSKIVILKRDTIRIEEQAAKLTFSEVKGKKIAVLKIGMFYLGLSRDVRKLLEEANDKSIDAIIIDLRNNGGGSLLEVIELAGLFISDGPVVQVRNANYHIRVYNDPDRQLVCDKPLLVMINRFSASASEIFSAMVQDYQRGIILGQNSFGKGTVQQSREIDSLSFESPASEKPLGSLTYTIQKFYRINGDSVQIKGVAPDILFPEMIDPKEFGEEREENALPWDKIPKAFYLPYPSLKKYLPQLRSLHQARIKDDPEFRVLKENLAELKRFNQQKYLSLQYVTRQKAFEKDEKKRLQNLNARFRREGKAMIKTLDALPKDYEDPDFFLKEAEMIAVDYIHALNAPAK